MSLKTLSLQRLSGNVEGNSKETSSFLDRVIDRQKTDIKNTFSGQSFPVSGRGNSEETSHSPDGGIDDAKGNFGEKFPKGILTRKPLLDNNIKHLDEKVSSFHGVGKNHGNREIRQQELGIEVWTNPHQQGTPEARRESLRLAMEANLHQAMADIQAGGYWKATLEVRMLEDAIDTTYIKVIAGQVVIQDFINLVTKWKDAGIRISRQGRDGA